MASPLSKHLYPISLTGVMAMMLLLFCLLLESGLTFVSYV
jgi:hypothetical protein